MTRRRAVNAVVLIALLLLAQGCADEKPTPDQIRRDIINQNRAAVAASGVGTDRQDSVAYGELTITDTKSSSGGITYTIDLAYGDKHYRGRITYRKQSGGYVLCELDIHLE